MQGSSQPPLPNPKPDLVPTDSLGTIGLPEVEPVVLIETRAPSYPPYYPARLATFGVNADGQPLRRNINGMLIDSDPNYNVSALRELMRRPEEGRIPFLIERHIIEGPPQMVRKVNMQARSDSESDDVQMYPGYQNDSLGSRTMRDSGQHTNRDGSLQANRPIASNAVPLSFKDVKDMFYFASDE